MGASQATTRLCVKGDAALVDRSISWLPVQLVGFAFEGLDGPVREGFVELGSHTILSGSNDAGKSRLLRVLSDALTSGRAEQGSAVLFATLTPAERAAVLRAARGTQPVGRVDPDAVARDFLAERGRDESLLGAKTFAFSAENPGEWLCWWCRDADVSDEDSEDESDIAIEIKRLYRVGRDQEWISQAVLPPGAAQRNPSARPTLAVGVLPSSVLPLPVHLPGDLTQVVADASAVVSSLLRFARWDIEGERGLTYLTELDPTQDVAQLDIDAFEAAWDGARGGFDVDEDDDVLPWPWYSQTDDERELVRDPAVDHLAKRLSALVLYTRYESG